MTKEAVCILLSFFLFSYKLFLTTTAEIRITKSKSNSLYQGMVQHSGSIQEIVTSSLVDCTRACTENDQCVSFFYNNISRECVMHAKDFTIQPPSGAGSGWQYYDIRDGTGRCPLTYSYYRQLDFCYKTDNMYPIEFDKIKSTCVTDGGKLAAVNSQRRQDYFSYFLNGRTIPRVCLAGHKQPDTTWELDDGTKLTYFNWASTDPDGGMIQQCLVMFTSDKWLDVWCDYKTVDNNSTCLYICEI